MKSVNKRYLVDEMEYNSYKNEEKILHPDVVSTLQHKRDMRETLNNPQLTDYDKVNHHASKLQQYLKDLKLAVTRSKSMAILGTPLPQANEMDMMNVDETSDTEEDTIEDLIDMSSSLPHSPQFQTPMSTPSIRISDLTPPDTPQVPNQAFKPRRKTTKSPSVVLTRVANEESPSTIDKTTRSPKNRHSKQKYNSANVLKQFSQENQPVAKNILDQLVRIPNFHWNVETGQTYMNNRPMRNTDIVSVVTGLSDPTGNVAFTPPATYKKLVQAISS